MAAFLSGAHEAETRCVPPRYAVVVERHFHALPIDLDHARGLSCELNHEAVLERRIRRRSVLKPEDFAFEVGVEIAVAGGAKLPSLSRCCVRCEERERDFDAKDVLSEFGRGPLDTQFCGATFDAVANGISDLASEPRKSHRHAHRE